MVGLTTARGGRMYSVDWETDKAMMQVDSGLDACWNAERRK